MKQRLLLFLLLSAAVQGLLAQEMFLRQNILIERYADMSTPVVDNPSELKLEKDIERIKSQVIRVNHYLSTYEDKIEVPFALEESQKCADYFCESRNLDYIMDRESHSDDMHASISFFPEYKDTEFYLQALLKYPTPVSVRMDSEYDENSRRLTVTISGDIMKYILLPYTKINLYLTQDDLYIKEIDKTEAVRHDDVLRAVLSSGTFGDDLVPIQDKYKKTYSYVIPEEIGGIPCIPHNMSVVAFIADKNGSLYYIRDSAKQKISEIVSVRTTQADKIHVYSDSGIVYILGAYDEANVYTPDGQLVKRIQKADSFRMEEGLYLMKLTTGGESTVRKIIVNG